MLAEEEKQFPKELRDKQLKSTGNERAWKYEDIPQVVKACRESGFAVLDVTTEFFLPDGTCELYWVRVRLKLKISDESWKDYVDRNCSEFLPLFKDFYDKTDFEKEGIEAFELLRKKKEAGVNIMNYLSFKLGVIAESRYLTLYK